MIFGVVIGLGRSLNKQDFIKFGWQPRKEDLPFRMDVCHLGQATVIQQASENVHVELHSNSQVLLGVLNCKRPFEQQIHFSSYVFQLNLMRFGVMMVLGTRFHQVWLASKKSGFAIKGWMFAI